MRIAIHSSALSDRVLNNPLRSEKSRSLASRVPQAASYLFQPPHLRCLIIAYGFQMGLRPQTLYGIEDSPVGLAAYFLDHDARSYELIARVFNGESEGLTRDDILDNITITWLTKTALSGARLYWEYFGKGYFNAKGVSIPVAVSVFPDELYPAPRSWAEQAYPKLIHYNRLPKGGHFAAFEQPKFLSEEIRAGLRSLRSGVAKAA